MFAAMVLEPLWKLYHQCITSNDLAGGVAWFSEEVYLLYILSYAILYYSTHHIHGLV